MSDVSAPQPGWYADPENPAGERWWNGSGWSDHKRESTETATAAAAGAAAFTVAPLAPTLGTPEPAATFAPVTPAADSAGFTFGTAAPVASDPRPDPYAPPAQGVATPYYSSPYVGAPYGAPPYGSTTNGFALAGLIVSAVSWLIVPLLGPIAGIILSVFGLRTARQREAAGNPNSGRGLAMAGLIVGIIIGSISALLAVVYFVAIFSAFTNPSYN
jgi:hypothetical protein